MFWITAFIRPAALERVRENLNNVGIVGMTISEVEGSGRQKGHTETYRGTEYQVFLIPKVRIEIACTRGELNFALEAIRSGGVTGKTGAIGDGKIFVFALENAVRIRTGESGKTVL